MAAICNSLAVRAMRLRLQRGRRRRTATGKRGTGRRLRRSGMRRSATLAVAEMVRYLDSHRVSWRPACVRQERPVATRASAIEWRRAPETAGSFQPWLQFLLDQVRNQGLVGLREIGHLPQDVARGLLVAAFNHQGILLGAHVVALAPGRPGGGAALKIAQRLPPV